MNVHRCRTTLAAIVAVLALCGLTAASALASGPPIVETKPATSIHATEATLNGSVKPNGATTKYYFEYGTTTSYGSRTAEATAPLNPEVSKVIEGLMSGTPYHFRIVATNSNGTSNGLDAVFTTALSGLPEFKFVESLKSISFSYSGESAQVSWVGGSLAYTCTVTSVSGEILPDKGTLEKEAKHVKNTKLVFKECHGGSENCPTGRRPNGEKEPIGQVTTEPLEGTLVYLSKAAKTVGIDLKPQSGTALAHFDCHGALNREVRGSVIMPITPVNTMGTGFEVNLAPNAEYENEANEKRKATLEWDISGVFGPMSWSSGKVKLLTSKELEVKA
jgi:hypothetical protein